MFDAMDVGILVLRHRGTCSRMAVDAVSRWAGLEASTRLEWLSVHWLWDAGGSNWSEKCIYDDACPVFRRKRLIRIDDDAILLF